MFEEILERLFFSNIVVTFGCHATFNDLRNLRFKSSFVNIFQRSIKLFLKCINLLYKSRTVSPGCILNISYSCNRVFSLDIFTYIVPSCVTSKVYQISFVFLQFEIRNNSSIPRSDVRMFFALLSYNIYFLSSLFQEPFTFTSSTLLMIIVGKYEQFSKSSHISSPCDSKYICMRTFQKS